jgi:hypothetical protein
MSFLWLEKNTGAFFIRVRMSAMLAANYIEKMK